MAYTKTNWSNGEAPAINGANLNKIEQGIYDATYVDGAKVGTSIDSNYKTNILLSDNLCNISLFGLFPNTNGTIISLAYDNAIIDTRNITSLYVSGDFSLLGDGLLRVGKYNTYPVIGSTGTRLSINTSRVIDTSDTNYVLLAFAPASGKTTEQIKNSFMVNEGNTAQPYQPYIPPTINVDGENIYVKGQNDFYSTQEQVIGTWIDGKPLYRKVYFFDNLPSNAFLEIADVSGLNIDNMPHLYGMAQTPLNYSSLSKRPLPFAGGGNDDIRLDIDNGKLRVRTYSNWSAFIRNYIVLEYTKTTD